MTKTYRKSGFTLVELLVVMGILTLLATVVMVVSQKAIKKSKAAVMTKNMQQMGTFITSYANDNQQLLMPCRDPLNGLLWHQTMLSMIFEGTDTTKFESPDWWEAHEDILVRNPLFKKADGFSPLTPGYGYNLMLPENYDAAQGGDGQGTIEETLIPMSYLDNPTRLPVVAPSTNYFYRYDEGQIGEFKTGTASKFLTDQKFPVLFLDSHVEMVTPKDYIKRRLHLMPLDPNAE